jgi:hypothetical protein
MKIFEKRNGRGIIYAKQELEDEIQAAKQAYGRRYRAAVKSHLRSNYRKKKAATIDLSTIGMSPKDKAIIRVSILATGSIQRRFNTCGKSDCPCMKGGKKHGPYWYLALPMPANMVRNGAPRIKHLYITEEEANTLKERIINYHRLQDKVWFELYDDFENGDVVDDLLCKGWDEKVADMRAKRSKR